MSHVHVTTKPGSTDAPHTPWPKALITAVIATFVVSLVLLAFAWPTVTSSAQHLPVAVVGSPDQVNAMTEKLPDNLLDLHPAADRDLAVHRIETREVYGAIILGEQPEILVAGAASPVASQMLTQAGTSMQRQIDQQVIASMTEGIEKLQQAMAQGGRQNAGAAPSAPGATPPAAGEVPTVKITDVVPLADSDPRGSGLAIAGLPLAMGGMIGGALISLLVSGTWRRMAAIAAYGVLGGLTLVLILQPWLDILQGSFWVNAGATGMGLVATAALIVGLNSVFGRVGIALGAIITVFIGNPLSGLTQPKEFILQPWGEIGQWLVPGLSGTILRDLSYFPHADLTWQALALAGWAVFGAILIMIGHYRNQGAVGQSA